MNEFEENRVHCWLKLYMLTAATSYRIKEEGRTFKSEYIISQSIMMACKRLGYDGVAYYSKRVYDEVFARCAINLALFVDYKGDYSELIKHMNELRCARTGFITNIGSYDRQYPYTETKYSDFDKFLFYSWKNKPNGKGKDQIQWGVPVD